MTVGANLIDNGQICYKARKFKTTRGLCATVTRHPRSGLSLAVRELSMASSLEWRCYTTGAKRIFSPRSVPGLSVTIGHYWYLFKRLTPAADPSF